MSQGRTLRLMPLKEKPARGRNYAPVEDLELARAWVYISTDAAIGVNQSAECFWTRVKETMEATETIATALTKGKLTARSWTSLQSHFGTISKLVSKFIRCSKKVEVTRESDPIDVPQVSEDAESTPGKKKRAATDDGVEVESLVPATDNSDDDSGKNEAKGVKAKRQKKIQEQLQQRSLKAQELVSASVASKVSMLKDHMQRSEYLQQQHLLVQQRQQRVQEEHTLQSMLNELFAVSPQDDEHAAYLTMRRESLMKRMPDLTCTEPAQSPTGLSILELCNTSAPTSSAD
ncbi:hypothetical protein PF010_g7892 [Phytophthora fragariae]|uniref:No apical meristem-associated C-terminal domain-containing protein n=1 Tax=Phytophthora fragariae TaxID=53985 RepID=A0A6G0LG34_9STRA|nr:hypothetical protein PF010_g7892 [Phytophthora fragariae]KAE9241514.1 hypothetical protein PF004_g7016 [Phytophthora fragariae]